MPEEVRTRGPEKQKHERTQPIPTSQSNPSIHIRRGQIMGVEGSERSDRTQPTTNRQSGKAHQTKTEGAIHSSHSMPQPTSSQVPEAKQQATRHPSCHDDPPSFPSLPTTFPPPLFLPIHAATTPLPVDEKKIPNQQPGCAQN